MCCYSKLQKSPRHWSNNITASVVGSQDGGSHHSYSGHQACFYIIGVLLVKITTFLPNLVEVGRKLTEQNQFFDVQDGGSRHDGVRLPGLDRNHRCVVFHSRYIPFKSDVNLSKNVERHQFSKIQDGGSHHAEFRLEGALRCDVVLSIKIATFPSNLVNIGKHLRERQQFLKIQDGGSRHVEFRLPDLHRYHGCVVFQCRYIPTKFGENW